MGCTRKTCGQDFKSIELAESVPVDSVIDGTAIFIGEGGFGTTDGGVFLGTVIAPGCDRTFGPGDCVEVQCGGEVPVKVTEDVEAGDLITAEGTVTTDPALAIGTALTAGVAGGAVTLLLGITKTIAAVVVEGGE